MNKKIYFILSIMLMLVILSGCQNQKAVEELKDLKAKIKLETQRLEKNKAIVRETHEEVWSKGNMNVIDELYSPNYIAHWVMGGDTGIEALKKMILKTRITFPDLTEKIIHMVAEGDIVVSHFITSGTFLGPMNRMKPNGKKGSRTEIAVHRLENGKIVEQWTVADLLTLLTQLGIKM